MSAGDEGRRRTQAWMGSTSTDEPVANPVRASRWVPADALPAYPQATSNVASTPSAASNSIAAPRSLAPLESSHQPAEIIGDRYRLLRQLARGAETEAWSAEHVELGRPLVIKFVHTDSSGVGDRLLAQARVLAKIRHPHVAEFSDFGRTPKGEPYLVMEQLDGRTLQQMLDQRGGIPWARAVAIVQQVGEALAAGHAQGVVHRDLRPANVFMIATGQPGDFIKVADFGLACDPDPRKITAASAGFASPEQAGGSLLDPRSDVYALGCLLFALIAGDPPFSGSAEQVLWAQINTAPKSLRERAPGQFIPEELQGIVTRCLEKLPARRFTDTRELGAALAQFARLAAAASHSGSPIPPAEPQASRSQVMGFAGRPAPKDVDELDRSLRAGGPITSSVPVVPQQRLSVLAIVGITLGVALLVGGAGIGVYLLVQSLLAGGPSKTEAAAPVEVEVREEAPATELPERAAASEPALVQPPAPATLVPGSSESTAPSPVPTPGDASKASVRRRSEEAAAEAAPSPEPALAPEPIKPTTTPDSKANDNIGHGDLVDPWG